MDKRTILLISAAVFIGVVLIVVFVSLLASGDTSHATAVGAAATVTAVASIEAARRGLASSTAKTEEKEKEAVVVGEAIQKNAEDYEVKTETNAKDIAAMTLEEKVALANKAPSSASSAPRRQWSSAEVHKKKDGK